MQNKYLEILELEPGASKTDIRAAYRRLSKKYHPDISRDADARERFIRINEAYRFLTRVGLHPGHTLADDEDPHAEVFDQWRQQARDYAMWKTREAEKRQSDMVRTILFGFNSAVFVILLFNVLLAVDFLLPPKEAEQEITRVVPVYENQGKNAAYRYDDVHFSDYRMRFEADNFKYDHAQPKGVLFFTPLFNKPIFFKAIRNGEAVTYFQVYNVYRIFGFIIPVILGVLFLYRFVMKSIDPQLTLAIFTIFIFLFQVYLFFRF